MIYYIGAYIFITLLSSCLEILGLLFLNSDIHLETYNSPFVILSSVIFFIIFLKVRINNSWINESAKSIFAVYIIHLSPLISSKLFEIMKHMYDLIGPVYYFSIIPILAILIMTLCIFIDKLRIYIYKLIDEVRLPFNKFFIFNK